jgi:hypothetical protein
VLNDDRSIDTKEEQSLNIDSIVLSDDVVILDKFIDTNDVQDENILFIFVTEFV